MLFLSEVNQIDVQNKKLAGLFFKEDQTPFKFERIKILSPNGDLREAAANLFHHLHELESMSVDMIIAEPLEESGLGIAIMDRLRKATNRYSNH